MSRVNPIDQHLQGKYVDSLIVTFRSEAAVWSTTMRQVNRGKGVVEVNAEVCQNIVILDC
jgi:hypothetical protein